MLGQPIIGGLSWSVSLCEVFVLGRAGQAYQHIYRLCRDREYGSLGCLWLKSKTVKSHKWRVDGQGQTLQAIGRNAKVWALFIKEMAEY